MLSLDVLQFVVGIVVAVILVAIVGGVHARDADLAPLGKDLRGAGL